MSKTSVLAGCLICFFGWLLISHTIVGSIILEKYKDLETACKNLWPYCVVAVVFTALSGCGAVWEAVKVAFEFEPGDSKKEKTSLTTLIALALFIWGIIIEAQITSDCVNFYKTNGSELYTLFQVSFGFIIAIFALGFIGACCAFGFFVTSE